jgi:fimbrial chaperone protein
VQDLSMKAGRLGFALKNGGNAHFVPDSIKVEGRSGDDHVVFSQPVNGWYVLAGGSRVFDVEIPKAECARVTAITVVMQVGTSTIPQRLHTPGGACGSMP